VVGRKEAGRGRAGEGLAARRRRMGCGLTAAAWWWWWDQLSCKEGGDGKDGKGQKVRRSEGGRGWQSCWRLVTTVKAAAGQAVAAPGCPRGAGLVCMLRFGSAPAGKPFPVGRAPYSVSNLPQELKFGFGGHSVDRRRLKRLAGTGKFEVRTRRLAFGCGGVPGGQEGSRVGGRLQAANMHKSGAGHPGPPG